LFRIKFNITFNMAREEGKSLLQTIKLLYLSYITMMTHFHH
jgi:hypothetical protein